MRVIHLREGDPAESDLAPVLEVVTAATELLAKIARLPAPIGSRIQWSNGVVWTRINFNAWQPDNLGDMVTAGYSSPYERWWPSAHVASEGWKEVPA